jgi:GMP synthase-like glutamine amidotransferase
MKPVAVFRHSATEGPGYFGAWLDRRGIPWRLVKIDEGDAVPRDPRAFAGLGLMGGPMSVNDDLPWIAPVLQLIRDAVSADVPVIGHCLGGQLMAKALGATVSRNPVKEIGWGRVEVSPGTEGRRWLGGLDAFESFHWHGETFTLPPGALRIATSAYCENQMFAFGKHLGMQCHVEMTPELIAAWCADWHNEVQSLAQQAPSVQTPAQMLARVTEKAAALNRIADLIYGEWGKGLARLAFR